MKFEDAVLIVLEHEGGYVNHPSDPGGETNFGISKRSYPNLDIKNLTKQKAIEIYRKDYWDAIKCDSLPEHLRLIAFDCAVNQGVGASKKIIDSIVMVLTKKESIKIFAEKRLARYSSINAFQVFGVGWIRRLISVIISSL